jgi:hypothetical protein
MDQLNLQPFPVKPKTLNGRQLAQRARCDGERTMMATQLMSGSVAITSLTLGQACAVTGARPQHVAALRHAVAGGSLARARHVAPAE